MNGEVFVGKLHDGFIKEGVYRKRSWEPYRTLFSHGKRYLVIKPWEEIKAAGVHTIQLVDMVTNTQYEISAQDAKKYGEPISFPGIDFECWRVPTKFWSQNMDTRHFESVA